MIKTRTLFFNIIFLNKYPESLVLKKPFVTFTENKGHKFI